MPMFGWQGKFISIDLSRRTTEIKILDPALCEKFIGGRGMAGHFLKDAITLPYNDPDMPLLFFTGPLVNTRSPTSGRMTVMSRSPLTGTIGDASVGGSFGTFLKKAGFDGIVITGRNENLCGIEIADDKIRIVSAGQFIGKSILALNRILHGKGATALIGPAAENGVKFSNLVIDGHYAAGRMGLGLVFAAKNIKYITVTGTGKTRIADPDALTSACEDVFRLVSASPVLMGDYGISRFGTGALYDLMDVRRMMPTHNFKKNRFEPAAMMNAPAFARKFTPRQTGCRGCHIRCKKKASDGRSLPEFESMSHFSALIGNPDLETVMAANHFCNDLGMDTISAASTLACYFELTGKHPATENIVALLFDIAFQKGIGVQLGQGAARFAENFGFPDAAMAVKRLELPAYDPRGAYGMALAYAVATRGGCHLRAYPISHEILRKPVPTDRFTFAGKARTIKLQEDINAVVDSLTACKFIFFAASVEEYAGIFTAVTGIETSGQELMKIGERICYQERIMNAQNGFTADDDDLPARFFKPPENSGDDHVIKSIDRKDFLNARAAYYVVRGLDETGMPKKKKAEALGLP